MMAARRARKFPGSMIQLQPNPDGPDLLQFQRWLLADQLPFVPRYYMPVSLGGGVGVGIHERLFVVERSLILIVD